MPIDVFMPELLQQTATYWAVEIRSGSNKPTFANPVTVACHWEEKSELFKDKTGKEVVSRSIVHVDRDMELDGYLFEGSSNATSPLGLVGAFPIRGWEKIPGIPAEVFVRKAKL